MISEFGRVLKDGGVIGFSEPGRFHSKADQPQYEMRNFNVLENDIDISEIFDIAKRSGFTNIQCKLLCDMAISIEHYQAIVENIQSLSIEKNVFGNICNEMTKRTIFFLYKGELIFDSRSHIGLSHYISINKKNYSIMVNKNLDLPLKIFNNGKTKWLNENINGIG